MANSIQKNIIELSVFNTFVSEMNSTVEWFGEVGESQKIFTEMMEDARISSLVNNRKDRVMLMAHSFTESGNKTVDDACRKHLDFNILFKFHNCMLNAIPFGISLCEVAWERKEGLWVPSAVLPIPRTVVGFPQYSGFPYGTPVLNGNIPLDDENKIFIHRKDSGDGNIWGSPALIPCYAPWKFKKLGFKFWALAARRLGVPSVIGIFETKNEDEAKSRAKNLAEMIGEMESGSSGAFANVTDVKVLDSDIKAFDVIVSVCDTQIAYALTTQSLTTNTAQYGTHSTSIEHQAIYKETSIIDAYQMQQTDQRLVDAFVRINFPGAASPIWDIDSADVAEWAVTRDAIDRGVPVSITALYEKYAIPKPKDTADSFVKKEGSFGFGDRDSGGSFFLS